MYSLNRLFNSLIVLALLSISTTCFAENVGHYGVGKTATAKEITGWDIDIRPDGKGLPAGQGSVAQGEPLYEAKCASCHGSFGEGQGRWPILAGGEDSLTDERPEKTVGSFWPYASTLWDYINRAMPYPAPKSLTADEVYAISAYILYLNEIVEDDFVLNQSNLANVKMPNEENFYMDDRPDTNNTRCMENCKNPKTIEVIHSLRGITPDQEDSSVKKVESKPELSKKAILGKTTYSTSCVVCHGSGVAGAPKTGDIAIWGKRMEQGQEKLVQHAINGFSGNTGIMPPKGGNLSLTDEQVTNAVHYMLEAK
ncbi:MAG: c-type cytochrome [Cycloclasticus sp.]|nr:c-type cytochrome [Cycloclasticus sp.]